MRYTVDEFSDILGGDNQHITEYLDYYVLDKKEPEIGRASCRERV